MPMRLWRAEYTDPVDGYCQYWDRSKVAVRQKVQDDYPDAKPGDITAEAVEIPVNKAGVLSLLEEYCPVYFERGGGAE